MADQFLQDESLTPEQCRPSNLDLKLQEQVLQIAWADGAVSTFLMPFLRQHCPCAQCRTERLESSRNPLHVLSAAPSGQIRITGGRTIGNYALQLDWSDGHNTGIYDFRLLRTLHHELP